MCTLFYDVKKIKNTFSRFLFPFFCIESGDQETKRLAVTYDGPCVLTIISKTLQKFGMRGSKYVNMADKIYACMLGVYFVYFVSQNRNQVGVVFKPLFKIIPGLPAYL